MATSQYSILRQYTPYISPYNIDLIKEVTLYKQGKVDANRAKMNQQIDYLMGQEIDKPEARAYMEDKMYNVLGRINETFKGADLSSDGVVRHIQGEISTVLDNTVLNAIAGTREGRRMQKEINDLKQNHPELYSPINEWDTMKNYYAWLQDGDAGSRLAPLHYTPYVDYHKTLNDNMLKFRKENKGKKIQIPETDSKGNPTGAMLDYNIDELSDSQVKNLVYSMMTPAMQEQMRIEANYMAATNPMFANPSIVNSYLTNYTQRYDRQISALTAQLAAVGDDKYTKNKILNNIENIKNEKAAVGSQIQTILQSGDVRNAAGFIVEQNLLNGLSDAWSYDNTSVTRSKDDVYFARLKEDREQRSFINEQAKTLADIDRIKAETQKTRIETERLKKTPITATGAGKGTGGTGGAGGSEGWTPAVVNTGTSGGNTVKLTNRPYEEINAGRQAKAESLSRFWSSISEEDKKNIMNAVAEDQKKNPELYQGMDAQEAAFTYLKNNKGYRNDYLNQPNSQAIREAYAAVENANAEINRGTSAIKDVSDMKKNTLGSVSAINKTRQKLFAYEEKGVHTDLGIKAKNMTDKQIAAYNVAVEALYGRSTDVGDTLNKLAWTLQGGSGSLWGAVPGMGFGDKIVNVFDTLFSSKDGRGTSTLASLNAIKEITGENFNIGDYITVSDNGKMEFTPYSVNDPEAIKIIRYASERRELAANVIGVLGDEIKYASDPRVMSDILVKNHYNDSFLSYVYSKDAPTNSDVRQKYDKLASIYTEKTGITDLSKVSKISIVSEPVVGGGINRYIQLTGMGGNSMVQISDAELIANEFDPTVEPRNYPTENYKSDISDCSFVDTSTAAGRDYDKRLVFGYGIQGGASKYDAKKRILGDIQEYASFLKPEDQRTMHEVGSRLIDMADNVAIQLEGYQNEYQKGIYVKLYDKNTINSANPVEIATYDLITNSNFADFENRLFEFAPQTFYADVVRKALTDRASSVELYYDPNGNNNIQIEGDLLSKLLDFYSKTYGNQQQQ